jgi:hypothetical protein
MIEFLHFIGFKIGSLISRSSFIRDDDYSASMANFIPLENYQEILDVLHQLEIDN